MKGRNNDKPVERYHPYIVALLKSKHVEGIKGGGYLPSHNFKMHDLDDKTREDLLKKKPELAELSDFYAKEGMTDRVLKLVSRGLSNNSVDGYYKYDRENKRFIVEEWTNFESFIQSIYDEIVGKILDIALGDADFQLDRKPLEEQFIDIVHELPESMQEKFIARAGTKRRYSSELAIEVAAKKLMHSRDDWFNIFEDLYREAFKIDEEAWERLHEYADIGWFFTSPAYTNIPRESTVEEFKNFVLGKESIYLYVEESQMIDFASEVDDESDYDDTAMMISSMRGDSGGKADWDNLDSYLDEKRREEGLIKRDKKWNSNDTWLAQVKPTGDLLEMYIQALQGYKSSSHVKDERQNELKIEGRKYRNKYGFLHL